MRLIKSTISRFSILLFLTTILGACASSQVSISKKELDVQTRTSTAIFVEPVTRDKRTVYLEVKSGVIEFDRDSFKTLIRDQLSKNGYLVMDDPETAQFQMLIYVLNLEKASPTAAESALGQGYLGSSVILGAAIGSSISSNHSGRGAVIGGIIVGAAELISSSMTKDVTYMLVADVQIREKAAHGAIVTKDTQIDIKTSDSSTSRQTASEVSNRKEYQTRIVTTANKVNLKLEEAAPLMFQKTAYAMAGFF